MPLRLVILLALLSACAPPPASEPSPASESLGACLASAGVRLYGASWCPQCHKQLQLFGPEAADIPYTDCSPEGSLGFVSACEQGGVPYGTTLPVWIFPDGTRLYGVRDPFEIAATAGCLSP